MQNLKDFEINLCIHDNIYTDVQYCSFIRTPLTKLVSFCIIKIVLPELQILELQSQISNNLFPELLLNIYTIPTSNTTSDTDVPELFFNKSLTCLSVSTNPIKLEQVTNICTLILVHPITYYLFKNNTYNTILENITGREVLDQFHNFLKDTFGDIFKFSFIGDNADQNTYRYEQILIKTKNDLIIPLYLINNYNINNSICFYFYDPFCISQDNDKEIYCSYINLKDYKKSFEQIDTFKYADTSLMINKNKTISIADLKNNIIDKNLNQFLFVHQDIKYRIGDKPTGQILKKSPSNVSDLDIIHDRKVKIVQNGMELLTNYNNSSAFTEVYCSDSLDNGQLRYNNAVEFYKNTIKEFVQYDFKNCIPDIFQLGKLYNLDPEIPNYYFYTPINIINCFIRKNLKEPYLTHMAKVLFLKYRNI